MLVESERALKASRDRTAAMFSPPVVTITMSPVTPGTTGPTFNILTKGARRYRPMLARQRSAGMMTSHQRPFQRTYVRKTCDFEKSILTPLDTCDHTMNMSATTVTMIQQELVTVPSTEVKLRSVLAIQPVSMHGRNTRHAIHRRRA